MSRRTLARVILLVWIGALALLARRELFRSETSTMTASAARLSPEARYYRVDAGGLQLGVINMNWDTLPTGFRVVEMLALDLPEGEGIRRHLRVTDITTTRALTLLGATRSYAGVATSEEVTLEVMNDSIHSYRIAAGGTPPATTLRLMMGTRPSLAEVLPLRLAFGGQFTSAGPITLRLADLDRRTTADATVRLLGDTTFILPDSVEYDTLAARLRTVTLDTVVAHRFELRRGGLPERWYVDGAGRLVRLETLFGVTVQRAPFDYSHTVYRDSLARSGAAPRRELAGVRMLAGSGERLDTGTAIRRFALSRRDGPLGAAAVAALAGGAQSTDGAVVTITRRWPDGDRAAPEGYLGREGRAPTGRIRLLADSAFAGARTARDSVVHLVRWVGTRGALDTTGTAHPEPEPTWRRRTIGADALARWVVQLAHAAMLPARVVNGVAVTGAGLLAHSWAELWVGGDWLPVDPAFGHVPASAQLLRLTEGGLGRPFNTLWGAAALRVEPLPPEGR